MENETITYPIKMYRLGEPARTVNSKADLEYLKTDGWSTYPQIYEHKEFPKCVFRLTESKTVRSQEELSQALKEGYATTPLKLSRLEELKSKIMYHNEEIERLQSEHYDLVGEYFPTIDNQTEIIEEIEPKKETASPAKRGRPKKG
jgi:hypothetical protein